MNVALWRRVQSQIPLNQAGQDVNDLYMDLLSSFGVSRLRCADLDISLPRHLPAVFARQCDGRHPAAAGRFQGLQYVGRVAAGADRQEDVAGSPIASTKREKIFS